MLRKLRLIAVAVWMAPLLAGCAVYDQALLPALTGEFSSAEAPATVEAPAPAPAAAPTIAIAPPAAEGSPAAGPQQPLAVIRFADPNVDVEGTLHPAVRRALSGKPEAGFSLVAVAPAGADGTLDEAVLQRNLARVLAALGKVGVTEDRVILTAAAGADAAADEVRVYVLDLGASP